MMLSPDTVFNEIMYTNVFNSMYTQFDVANTYECI